MNEGDHNAGSLLNSLRRVGDSLLGLAQSRFELFTAELQEEKLRALKLLVWLVVALALIVAGLTVGLGALAIYLWNIANLSAGESLNSEAEQSRRLISQLAGRISTLLAEDNVTRCSIAISGAIHNQLLDALDPKACAKIGQVLASNLTKTLPSELHAHFKRQLV